MSLFSIALNSIRSKESVRKTLTLNASLTMDTTWMYSDRIRRRLVLGTCFALILLTFLLSFGTALRLKMHSIAPYWVYTAVPAALSNVAYGHDRNYMALNFVNDTYYSRLKSSYAKDVNRAIAAVLAEYPIAPEYSDQMLSSDDKGIVVLTEIAFRVFGYKIEGVLYMYYVILGMSAALFAYSFRRNPYALLMLAAFLLLHRMILPMINYDAQLGGVTALRCMPVLAMIACLHGIMFAFESKVDTKKIAAVVLQILIIVLVIHIRSTAIWELVLVAGASFGAMALRRGPVSAQSSRMALLGNRWPTIIPLVASIMLLLLLNLHRAYGFPEEYHRNGETSTRPFWHNIYSGFAFNPAMAARYDLRVDDLSVMVATKKYLLDRNKAEVWEAAGGNTPDFRGVRWKAYDEAVKDMLVFTCTKYLSDCISTFIYYKPLSMFRNLLWVCGWIRQVPDSEIFVSKFPQIGSIVKQQFDETTRQLDLHKERGRMWLRYMSAMVAAFALLAVLWKRREDLSPVLASAAVLAAGSTVPSIVGYAAPHTIAEAALAIPMLLVAMSTYFVYRLFDPRAPDTQGNNAQVPDQV